MINIAIVLLSLIPSSTAQDDPRWPTECIFEAAPKLPQIAGLVIKDSRIRRMVTPPPKWIGNETAFYSAEFDVVAAGRSATFKFYCGFQKHGPISVVPDGITR